ncbi:hypothetical protein Clacol_004254 [Clathrus columnatus]|uniref:Uncharacterized protein n=1 Tax=Clathrus columnatus TaxID=1419009 RepID=A0AAV5AA30_9AGAM|nr:hypothetical protein Clacol_004254 [Clathrus columnatus]
MLTLYYPQLYPREHTGLVGTTLQLFSQQNFTKHESSPGHLDNLVLKKHLDGLARSIGKEFFPPSIELERFGKLRLKNKHVLRTALIELPETEDSVRRYYRWFKGITDGAHVYGEALAFYKFIFETHSREVVLFRPLIRLTTRLNVSLAGEWSDELKVLDISNFLAIIGIWRVPKSGRVYVLQKHLGLEMLSLEETEAEAEHGL